MTTTLSVRNLSVRAGSLDIVRGIDLDIAPGEKLGIIGESGSGKTVSSLAILRLLPPGLTAQATSIQFRGQELTALSERDFLPLRGRSLAMVFQDPVGAFNPAKRIDWHLRVTLHRRDPAIDWHASAVRLLSEVGIAHPDSVLGRYPHQLSGGMLQRVMIAMVLGMEPALIVADEPTTNLDNIVEEQVLALFTAIQARLGAAMLFITHDIAMAGRICDQLAVMYAGEIVETGPAASVLATPAHPYTQGLVATARALARRAETLAEIPGQLPPLGALPPGCVFQPRCAQARPGCERKQALRPLPGARAARCLLHD